MSNRPANFVTTLDPALAGKLKKDLSAQGFELSQPPHTEFSAKKKGLSCTLYSSGKLVVQGKEKDEFIEFYLEPEVLKSFTYTHQASAGSTSPKIPHIGIDESGKGDLFGPLCIAGVYADAAGIEKLLEIGVQDSKKMTDKNVEIMAKKIRENFAYHCVRINPPKYNQLYSKFRNLNYLLGWGHATTIDELIKKTGCTAATIDQFADERVVINAINQKGIKLQLTQRHKGEEDPVVAAASILARDLFLFGLKQLSDSFGITLPKGVSPKTKAAARQFIEEQGTERLPLVCKMHFKTVNELTGHSLSD